MEREDFTPPAFAREELSSPRIQRLRKSSPHAWWRALTAELTFFTHGMYTASTPPANRLSVNLWHGDGPKLLRDTELVRSTVTVSGSALWSRYKQEVFDVDPDGLAVVGNPRVDQFAEVLPDNASAALGLRPGRLRVLWMPTYREARGPRARAWADAHQLTSSVSVLTFTRELADAADALGVDLVIKPHPLDVDSYGALDVRVVTDAQLEEAGMSLYQVLGQCDALISDVSSVWVDFLALDRPVAFYIPDLDELQTRRGLNVDDLEGLLPGVRLRDPEDGVRFLDMVLRGDAPKPHEYPHSAALGVPSADRVADRLMDWLNEFQARRGRSQLFLPARDLAPTGRLVTHQEKVV
jgi:CDP-glycerol glycerophosphotransferase (TagB/SpsB family)